MVRLVRAVIANAVLKAAGVMKAKLQLQFSAPVTVIPEPNCDDPMVRFVAVILERVVEVTLKLPATEDAPPTKTGSLILGRRLRLAAETEPAIEHLKAATDLAPENILAQRLLAQS